MEPGRGGTRADATLEAVDVTGELARRPARASDHVAENRALVALAERMASAPKDVLDTLALLALELCRAGSSGISVAEEADGEPIFRWRATAGDYAPLLGTAVPRDASPCEVVLSRLEPLLLARPERHFGLLRDVSPPVVEALLVPLVVDNEARGTLWIVAHSDSRRFDAEDVRLLQSLSRFASLALQTQSLRHAESALGEIERRFERFMKYLPGLAWIKDLAGRYVFANDAATSAFQRDRAELVGKTDAEIFPAGIARQFAENDRLALAHGAGVETIETLEHADGLHHSLVAKFPIPGPDGRAALVGGVAIDITARLQAEEILRESEQRFREMADNSPAIIYTTQTDGYCTFLSPAWTELTGLQIERGLGFGWANAVHPDDIAHTRAVFDPKPVPTRFRIEFRLAHAGGGHHWVIGSGVPRFSPDGEFLGFVGSVLDIDKEKRSEEALRASVQLYRAIGESIDYGVWVCDTNGRNVYASQSFLNLVGLTQQQCSNFGWTSVLHPEDQARTEALWRECVRTGQAWDMEHRVRGVDGEWHPVLARGVPVTNERGETIAWAGINLDISRLKKVEEELREVDRRKDEFLATLAHELRNPLAPIKNSLHVLQSGAAGTDPQQLHDMIDRQATHLIRLVDDLLEVARMNSGKIELRRERVELAEVVKTAVETSRPAIEAARHRLEISLPAESLELEADAVRLAQVISNLLNNAAKYTEGAGTIWLRAERQGRWVSLSVRDTGIGIPPAMLSRIFDLFTQVDGTLGRAQGGLGIGLALVKRLVELHGGTVQAKSAGRGGGSEFAIRLPLAPPRGAEAVTEPTPSESLADGKARRRVLVVDDNRDAADSLAILLRLQGLDVHVAYDGPSAVAVARAAQPEVVLLDLAMPGMDGFAVASALRREPALRDTRLVALTGWGQPDHRAQTAGAGFDAHLVKPVRVAELQALLALRHP